MAPVATQTRVTSPEDASLSALASLASFGSQISQLQLVHSIEVLRMTSAKGTIRQKINQMSIIFMSEVGGSSSILLVKMVVITSMMVRFTAMASPNRSLSKKMVTNVMRSRRMVGR